MPPGLNDLNALARKARELASQVDKGDVANLQGLHVHRTMTQVLEEAQELHRRTNRQQPEATLVNAQILHARHGLDLSQFGQLLPSMRWGTDTTAPTPTSIEGFLKTERQTALMMAIQKSQKNTTEQFQSRSFESMLSGWEAEKEEVREILGVGPMLERLDVTGQSAGSVSRVSGGAGAATGATSMDLQMTLYAKVVADLADANLREAPFNVVQRFREVCNSTEDARKKDIDSCWSIVDGMLGREGSQTLKKNHFQQGAYAVSDRRRVALTTTLIANAKDTLQRRYLEFMDSNIRANSPDERMGASAGTYDGIRDFVYSRRVSRHSEVWACIYYAIRCGRPQLARQFAENELAPEDHPVVSLLDDCIRGTVPKSQAWALQQYLFCRKNGGDPYKRAVINILGRCEPQEDIHNEIAINIEDFLWVKLNLIRSDVQDAKLVVDDFVHLQRLISITHGEAHFQADKRPLRYFTVLLFTAQFEKAIEFLRQRDLRLAVHFAIALQHYGVLRTSKSVSDPMLREAVASAGKDMEQVFNFGLLVQRYVRTFARTDSYYALRYYFLLSDTIGTTGNSLFEQCLCDLVVETCEWTTILGELDSNGRKKAAQIDIFFPRDEDARRRIIQLVAEETERKGRILDALRLYDLADCRQIALSLLCRSLSQEAAVRPATKGSTREETRQFAQYVNKSVRYESVPRDCNDAGAYHDLRLAVPVLLKFFTFFDAFFNERFDEALRLAETMRDLNIVPVNLEHVPVCVANFEGLTEEVRRNLPQMLLYLMISLDNQYKMIRAGAQGFVRNDAARDGGREQAVQRIREKARAIVTYAGQITFRLPGLTNAELIRIEVGLML